MVNRNETEVDCNSQKELVSLLLLGFSSITMALLTQDFLNVRFEEAVLTRLALCVVNKGNFVCLNNFDA
jgi:hypothetical protein